MCVCVQMRRFYLKSGWSEFAQIQPVEPLLSCAGILSDDRLIGLAAVPALAGSNPERN